MKSPGARHDEVRARLSPDFHQAYVLKEPLGEGATSVVFHGEQRVLRRAVVLKILTCEDEEMRQRFVHEANALAAIDHPGIVKMLDFGCDGSYLYLVMPRIPGSTLEDLARRTPVSWRTLAGIAVQLTQALEFLEERGILHRDIKPSNVWVGADGVAHLLDFGIARAGEGHGLTKPGHFLGSPAFASPEQLLGDRLDHRSDLYSLGVTLLTLLTGKNPFCSGSLRESLQLHLGHHVREVELPEDAPAELGGLVVALLRKEPQARPWNAAEVRSRLEACLAGTAPAGAGTTERAAHAPATPEAASRARPLVPGLSRLTLPPLLAGLLMGSLLAVARHPGAGSVMEVTSTPPSPLSGASPPVAPVALPPAELAKVRDRVLRCIDRARDRQMTRVTLGFEQGRMLNADYGSRLLGEEIDDHLLLDRTWTELKRSFDIGRLPLADRVLLASMLGLRYLNLANLGAFKADAPPWLRDPPLEETRARFFRREVTPAQGARALMMLVEYLDVALDVFVDHPVDGYEATVPLEHCLTFFDVSRAIGAYQWNPELRGRIEKLQQRVEATLGEAVKKGDGIAAQVPALAWVAWRSGMIDLTRGFEDLKVEAGSIAEALRREGVPLPEARFRGTFFYFFPGTARPSYGPNFPFPPE